MATLGAICALEKLKNNFSQILKPHVSDIEFSITTAEKAIKLTSSNPYLLAVVKGIICFPHSYGFGCATEAAITHIEEDTHHDDVWYGTLLLNTQEIENFFKAIKDVTPAKSTHHDWLDKNPVKRLLNGYEQERSQPPTTPQPLPWIAYSGSISPRP